MNETQRRATCMLLALAVGGGARAAPAPVGPFAWKERFSIPRGDDWWALCLAFSPDGKVVAAGHHGGAVTLWDTARGKPLTELKARLTPARGQPLARGVAFSPDGKTLAVAECTGTVSKGVGQTSLWDVKTGKALALLKGHTDGVIAVAFSPDGKLLATGGADRTTRLWDVKTGEELAALKGSAEMFEFVAFSPDGKALATGGGKSTWSKGTVEPGEVRLWDVAKRKPLRTLGGHPDIVSAGAFSRDGKTLATGCFDGSVRLWDVATGKLRSRLAAHKGFVFAVALTPDGKAVITAGDDKSIKVWEAGTGKLQETLPGHRGRVSTLALSQDGRLLASASAGMRSTRGKGYKGEVKVWERVRRPPAEGK